MIFNIELKSHKHIIFLRCDSFIFLIVCGILMNSTTLITIGWQTQSGKAELVIQTVLVIWIGYILPIVLTQLVYILPIVLTQFVYILPIVLTQLVYILPSVLTQLFCTLRWTGPVATLGPVCWAWARACPLSTTPSDCTLHCTRGYRWAEERWN